MNNDKLRFIFNNMINNTKYSKLKLASDFLNKN